MPFNLRKLSSTFSLKHSLVPSSLTKMDRPILTLTDLPTIPQLYTSSELSPPPLARHSHDHTLNSKIALVRYDITKLQVDVIVNAANQSLRGGGGVDGAIHRVAGPRLLDECLTLDGCDTGDAKITAGYSLPAKHVIHAVGPVYHLERRVQVGREEMLLRQCYRRGLEITEQKGLKSVAFSAISTGVYGYPSHKAAPHAISEVRSFFESGRGQGIERVVFCNFMEKDEKAYKEALP
jgi:O-acetyl-ADP-ribose deacetylase (regulator of RNase III)